MTLSGLFFTQECGDHFHTGMLVRQVHPDAYLAQFDRTTACDMPIEPLVLFTVSEDLSATDDDGRPVFHFFETREHLQAWLTWLEAPINPAPDNVTRIDKKERRH